jgi:hypothetical protein
MMRTVIGAGAALIGAPVAHANPNPDPSEYYQELRRDGFLVDGNDYPGLWTPNR